MKEEGWGNAPELDKHGLVFAICQGGGSPRREGGRRNTEKSRDGDKDIITITIM